MNAHRFAWFLAAACLAASSAVRSAEIKVLATIAVKAVMDDLVPRFERDSGHKVAIRFGTGAMLRKQIDAGESFDVAILTPPEAVDALVKQGLLAADSVARFAGTRVGMAVRAGAPRPDIGSPEALKQALLAAKSVGHTDPAPAVRRVCMRRQRSSASASPATSPARSSSARALQRSPNWSPRARSTSPSCRSARSFPTSASNSSGRCCRHWRRRRWCRSGCAATARKVRRHGR